MVTMAASSFSAAGPFHGAMAAGHYDNDALNFHSFELSLNDVANPERADPSSDAAEERAASVEPTKPARRGSLHSPEAGTPRLEEERDQQQQEQQQQQQQQQQRQLQHNSKQQQQPSEPPSSGRPSVYRQTSAHRLFRAAAPEPKRTGDGGSQAAGAYEAAIAPMSGGEDPRLRALHAADSRRSPPPPPPGFSLDHNNNTDRLFPKRRGRDDREVLDGTDVLQQISNLTSTEPSNEREVFVGGLRESEDSVHITEEELATYFAKFGVIESVSINRDDRTQRGRGFAFVKFFQESAALNAVVADASTHVIRGTTVSVQWSRGAKDAGGDRPRRRNSGTSNASSGNGSSPPGGGNRSSPKMAMFPHKGGGGGGRSGGGGGSGGVAGGRSSGGGGGGGGSCGVGCSHGFSPMRSRGAGNMSSGGGGVPYGFGGGRHGEHHNQPMVCVVVPAQRAAALGLAAHPAHHLHSPGTCTSRGSPPHDTHFAALAQSNAVPGGGGGGGGGGRQGHPSHMRSHSQPMSGGGGGSSGGYGHHGSPHGSSVDHHHGGMASPHHVSPSSGRHVSVSAGHHMSPSGSVHHVSPSAGHHVQPNPARSYGGPPSMHMPPMRRERRRNTEPREYPVAASGHPSYSEYDNSSENQAEHHLDSNSYVSPEWGYDDAGSSRGGGTPAAAAHSVVRPSSPPATVRSSMHAAFGGGSSSRNGGGAPRPPAVSPRAYDNHYSSTRYNSRGIDGFSVTGISGGASGGVAMRRRSESSAVMGRSSMQQDALAAAASYYYSVDDMGKDDVAYEHDYGSSYGAPSRLP